MVGFGVVVAVSPLRPAGRLQGSLQTSSVPRNARPARNAWAQPWISFTG